MTKPLAVVESISDLTESGICDLVVVDLTFRVVSVDLLEMEDGELFLGLPWSLDYPRLGGRIHMLSWESFGENGLN